MNESRLYGIFEERGKRRTLFTKSLAPGKTVYDERLVKEKGKEYRSWNPEKSKLAAAIMKGASQIGIKPGTSVLYLGASTGTTVSHVSDIVGKDGFIYAVEFAPRVARELVFLSEDRPNIAPILADANQPNKYADKVSEVDVVFQDIAQKNQVEIFLKNIDTYLRKGGFALLALKARSVDVTRRPKQIFNQVRAELERKVTIVDYRVLDPFEKDHCMFVVKK